MNTDRSDVDVTVVVPVLNEAKNLGKCLASLQPARRILVVDSGSIDGSADIAADLGADVVQFPGHRGYPKKRQWALNSCQIETQWVLMVDADEVVPDALWHEICRHIDGDREIAAYSALKEFHFLGKRFRFGGFSHSALVLFQPGKARFEELLEDYSGLDMEVHERVIVDGPVGSLSTPLKHEDFKGLEAYMDRHNRYSTWEAMLRQHYLETGTYGKSVVQPRLFGTPQEVRRLLKLLIVRMPFESLIWFCYHYFFRMGLLEGRRGLIACQIRKAYIDSVRAKMFELKQRAP